MDADKTYQQYHEVAKGSYIPRVIVCAAIRFGDTILAGARHWDCIMVEAVEAVGGWSIKDGLEILRNEGGEEQGFIDQYGEFLGRKEAAFVATANGQIGRNGEPINTNILYSEDLY